MDLWIIWVVAGLALVIAELVTGTFYLLVIGIGAFAGAVAAWFEGGLVAQSIASGLVAVLGAYLVHIWHAKQPKTREGSNFLDRGQAVVLEGWSNEAARIARVKYRGSTWEARLSHPEEQPSPGSTLYIEGQDGSTLLIAATPPAR
jgi:membrane protein implicated in regulation of membrane protease activity